MFLLLTETVKVILSLVEGTSKEIAGKPWTAFLKPSSHAQSKERICGLPKSSNAYLNKISLMC